MHPVSRRLSAMQSTRKQGARLLWSKTQPSCPSIQTTSRKSTRSDPPRNSYSTRVLIEQREYVSRPRGWSSLKCWLWTAASQCYSVRCYPTRNSTRMFLANAVGSTYHHCFFFIFFDLVNYLIIRRQTFFYMQRLLFTTTLKNQFFTHPGERT
jgi:hypothetical protein